VITREQVEQVLGHTLSDEQWLSTSAPLDSGVIVAGAGSGKTSVMAARVIWAVGSGHVTAEQVLGLTFTRKAAAELLKRIRDGLARATELGCITVDPENPSGDPLIATYHSFAAGVISENGIRLGIEPTADVLSPGARAELAARVVRTADRSLGGFDRTMSVWVRDVLALDDALADTGVDPLELIAWDTELIEQLVAFDAEKPLQEAGKDMLATSRQRRELAGLVQRFREVKHDLSRIDFADQTRLALKLANAFEDVRTLSRERHRLVLLDEYQDTSLAQRMLLQSLFAHAHPVTAVGDQCQAIYGFRGATVDNIDNFLEHFPSGAVADRAEPFSLSANRRSGPQILELANLLSVPLREAHTSVRPLAPAAGPEKGEGQLTCALFETIEDETRWVVEQVAHLGKEAGRWSDIAVLVRAREYSVEINSALVAAGIPTQIEGASELLDRPEIIELRSILEVLIDPTANVALMRLLAGPRWALGVRDLAALGARAAALIGGRQRNDTQTIQQSLVDAVVASDPSECISLLEALDVADDNSAGMPPISSAGRARLGELADELRGLRRHLDEPLQDIIGRVLAVTGLGVEAAIGEGAVIQTRGAAISEFMALATTFSDSAGGSSLLGFLGMLQVCEQYGINAAEVPSPAHPDAVRIMTVHKAKGLEFRHVVLPYLSTGVFPSSQGASRWPDAPSVIPWDLREDRPKELPDYPVAGESPRSVQLKAFEAASRALDAREELRLAYVAVTRAESSLTMSAHWWGSRQTKSRGPSEVLTKAHAFIKAQGGNIPVWASAPEDDATNPLLRRSGEPLTFPFTPDSSARDARLVARDAVLAHMSHPGMQGVEPLAKDESLVIAEWDRNLPLLLEAALAASQSSRRVQLPDSLSASDVIRLADDPDRYLLDLARPMPRPPAPAAARGTRFHAWVESRYGQQPLLLPDDLPGAADDDIESDADLQALQEAFERSDYSKRTPIAIEAPFALVLAGRVVSGRIDAVFDNNGRPEVIDWKTGRRTGLHPLQLAIYRLAWAEQHGLSVDEVDAAFLLVSSGKVDRPYSLPDREGLERILRGGSQ
jgi:DNA helicase-2/ATP-dependent DNA helicase PcrA